MKNNIHRQSAGRDLGLPDFLHCCWEFNILRTDSPEDDLLKRKMQPVPDKGGGIFAVSGWVISVSVCGGDGANRHR
ncbi:MAG TPA: hypothetical protein PKA28_14975 [Methylomusa anaerophila]|uniref:hypothetical protein n=1 Tax=Methylomusa anaerophila TaxID=1930071 RepID=UPI000F82B23E|nr:hypothetical protein [Methylomusa anaerophila]HML89744.1 hypothetical protein [Methylomusa anaerophila]